VEVGATLASRVGLLSQLAVSLAAPVTVVYNLSDESVTTAVRFPKAIRPKRRINDGLGADVSIASKST